MKINNTRKLANIYLQAVGDWTGCCDCKGRFTTPTGARLPFRSDLLHAKGVCSGLFISLLILTT